MGMASSRWISKAFYVGKYPVTLKLWKEVMEDTQISKRKNDPITDMSWFTAVRFCNKLSELTGKEPVYTINGEDVSCNWDAKGYRLLSEA